MDHTRRGLIGGILPAGLGAGIAAAAWPGYGEASPGPQSSGLAVDVTAFGAVGDGESPCADGFQAAIDEVEARGGGIVQVPAGVFVLEKTPLIGSRVHLRGVGAASVLRGRRPPGDEGAALISNKGQQARGYEGAHDWSISHFAIDSPQTNGIVVTHAARVYIGFILGIEVFHHFVDTAGRDILCEHLWLTGHSGTSSFQIDSLSGAQTIWDGERAVPPHYDGTDSRDVILRSSIITATAGSQGDRPRHDSSIHFHGDDTAGFLFSDLILGGAAIGVYQDAGTRYDDIQISNVRSHNPVAALRLNAGRTDQRGLMVRGFTHVPPAVPEDGYRGLEIAGRRQVILADIQLQAPATSARHAVHLAGCREVRIHGLQASAAGGTGVVISDHPPEGVDVPEAAARASAGASSRQILLESTLFSGFAVGCELRDAAPVGVQARGNLFDQVATPYRGLIVHDLQAEVGD
ncbi:MAG: hypothetical protein JJT93_09250 [Gammaproteobacteria bacterium]|nr:hypothetical protein [Gammaproteobacteria bacterium]